MTALPTLTQFEPVLVNVANEEAEGDARARLSRRRQPRTLPLSPRRT